MVTSQATAPPARPRARWNGTSASRSPGTNRQLAATKVRMRPPGGPVRAASQSVLWAAASGAATATRIAVESVEAAVTSAIPTPASMPRTITAMKRAREAYGSPCE
ncbi:hypothetical protein amrb99_76430 [Actinomadura sp. RB99]|nr:hypothetical protein [Actinomadura sp. RB99]